MSVWRDLIRGLCLTLTLGTTVFAKTATPFYLGADLSFTNEMEDCGAVFRDHGQPIDPFFLMSRKGGNLVRVRIWNDAKWTRYSGYDDVLKTISRAHKVGMQVLLDFHYSDDWADGGKQIVPEAWSGLNDEAQAEALYAYTQDIILRLSKAGERSELVQVGNEINPELMGGKEGNPINWKRNALLINAGIKAVRDAGRASGYKPLIMLHIAQPENVIAWFEAAQTAGVRDFDMIGISYYRKWSKYTLAQLGEVIAKTRQTFGHDVMVVETAYPFTEAGEDESANLLGPDTLIPGYAASPKGQLKYLSDLRRLVADNGGNGVVYWAPDWVSTHCKTRWGTGSGWENATWFDLKTHEALPAFEFMTDTKPQG